jgi:hypothetical protein
MDEERLSRLEEKLDELDRRSSSMERALDRSRAAMDTIVPSDTRRHIRAAWRENLLAVRSLIDFWAERLEDRPGSRSDESKAANGRENIPID